jgi:alkanesulfonate monooxygenase SsuD/methylene tetrahydromethanopterin reductase-like flavin-dependent oxidoreductase (luciferase family)
MELATLANLHPNRLHAAFGHGVEAWMRQIGARPPNRIAAMREVVQATRALLHGEEISRADGYVHLDSVRLDQPPPQPPPLLIGTTGERGMATAREVADGLVLPEGSSAAAVEWASELMGPAANIVVYAWLRIDDDGRAARERLAPMVQAWRDGGMYPNLVVRAELETGEIGDDAVRRLAVAGTPEECAEAVQTLAAAGAGSVVLVPAGGEPTEQLERFAESALPLIAAA